MKENKVLGILLMLVAFCYPFEAKHFIVGLGLGLIAFFAGSYLFIISSN